VLWSRDLALVTHVKSRTGRLNRDLSRLRWTAVRVLGDPVNRGKGDDERAVHDLLLALCPGPGGLDADTYRREYRNSSPSQTLSSLAFTFESEGRTRRIGSRSGKQRTRGDAPVRTPASGEIRDLVGRRQMIEVVLERDGPAECDVGGADELRDSVVFRLVLGAPALAQHSLRSGFTHPPDP
jgi:hypothetical protein